MLIFILNTAFVESHRQKTEASERESMENDLDRMARAYGFESFEEMQAHEERFLPEQIRAHYGLEDSGYYDKLAEEYEQEDNRKYGQGNERQDNGTSAERLEESDSAGTRQNDSGSSEVLSEEQSADTAGATVGITGQTSESSGTAEGSAEGVAENEAVSGESVAETPQSEAEQPKSPSEVGG